MSKKIIFSPKITWTLGVALLFLATAPVQAQPEQFPVQYSVKFVCGFVPEQPPGEEFPLKPGNYATAINVHNYTTTQIFGAKRIALHYACGTPAGQLPPIVPVGGIKAWNRRVLEIDCPQIWAQAGLPPETFVKGMVHIGLERELPIAAVYTSQTDLGFNNQPPVDPGAGISIDVENIEPFLVLQQPVQGLVETDFK